MNLNFFWFRRDLRLNDNAGLYHALRSGNPVQCVFIFDKEILDRLPNKQDRRVVFIHRELERLNEELTKFGSTLIVRYGSPKEVWSKMADEFSIGHVYTNHDYEPYATKRDSELNSFFEQKKIGFSTFKDQVIFEKSEVVKDDGTPYAIFTPYMKAWRKKYKDFFSKAYPTEKYSGNFQKTFPKKMMPLEKTGFAHTKADFPSRVLDLEIVSEYENQRDIPSVQGTSRLSLHLRFGTISIRELIRKAWPYEKWINELIWREFYMMILWHYPHVVDKSFKPQYDRLVWLNNEDLFNRWCEGNTGYPIVDAGMRELNNTGFMHNRVRMITAMFLSKYLLIDWRWGEAYFAEKLLDYELASNNGGWQWSASTGADAAPYFRLFNMDEQTKRFDPEFLYIKKWVPEFQELTYAKPIVDYKFARERCLAFYKAS